MISNTEFYFNYAFPKEPEKLASLGLECYPGRTVIKMIEKKLDIKKDDDSDEDNNRRSILRRSHMNSGRKEEYCKVCTCSDDGKSEHCSGRPAVNVNECMRMTRILEDFNKNVPFEHTRGLAFRIRRVGSTAKNDKCIPFVSQYTDCTEENECSGCKNCLCVGDGVWSCNPVKRCPGEENANFVDENVIEEALGNIERDFERSVRNEKHNSKDPFVPAPRKKGDSALLDADDFISDKKFNFDAELVKIIGRRKRSVGIKSNKTDGGIKFYHTVDDINEDILKNDNRSGTIEVRKISIAPKASRRTGVSDNESLHIEFSEPKAYDAHIVENKIDVSGHSEDIYRKLEQEKINAFISNNTLKQKDKELSKLIVNELTKGAEVIGDKNAPIISNITFTPENDTLTAMAFIAGNLLNKLWDMQKDSREESKGTEDLKQEKIADLLDLFKEPLNVRQENFLKSALEQLSVAIDKDKVLKDVKLCDKIDEARRITEDQDNEDLKKDESITFKLENTEKINKITSQKNENEAKLQAVSKVREVLNLIEKFQHVHKTLNDLKQADVTKDSKQNPKFPRRKSDAKTVLTKDENITLNVFGKILEKITKLLIPHKKSKKIVKAIKSQNLFAESSDITEFLKSNYGIDIGNSTLTTKDKIALDYLNTIKKNPNCIFHNPQDISKSFPNVEGDILLNLSEFLKVKSFVDLLKLLELEKKSVRSRDDTQKSDETTILPTTLSEISLPTSHSTRLAQTKEKLKDHIKSIIDDLRELQVAKGFSASNISIADTLPCIYNILNTGQETQDKLLEKVNPSPVEKVSVIFNSLKRDLLTVPTRRNNIALSKSRPKSAIVWERIVKNFDGKSKQMTRRIMDNKEPKSFDELKKMIKEVELGSKAYKNEIIIEGIHPAKRLTLLKTLKEETRKYIEILENIRYLLPIFKSLSKDKQNDLKDFLFNAAMNINLNNNVVKNINKFLPKRNIKEDVEIITPIKQKIFKESPLKKLPVHSYEVPVSKKGLKLTRDEIINQLINNRMKVYIRLKESKGTNLNDDVNYAIAKRILHYLEMGNYNLARDLYKYIINQKEQSRNISNEYTTVSSMNKYLYGFQKEPLLQFEEPTTPSQYTSNNSWLKQLLNLKKI
ncbi:hypothetical protein evm_001848 [Chilo suppressalis]|nr:hypothetical protein evm_001848 [Chilo suppressalis]